MKIRWLCLVTLILFVHTADAVFVYHDGELTRKEDTPYLLPQDHYDIGMNAFRFGDMALAIKHLHIVSHNYPDTPSGQDAFFYLGVAYFKICEFDLANNAFNQYLSCLSNPRYFLEALEYKFDIAEKFRKGTRRHFRGSRFFPKWASARSLALDIYNEVIASMPGDELTVRSIFSKACLLWHMGELRESVETFQTLIRRFPKNEYAPKSYARIMQVYIDQAKREKQNPDILTFAQMNLSRFEADFPRDELLETARDHYCFLKELYARSLYETAIFYERLNQPRAAVIYYQKSIFDFPETSIAKKSRSRLSCLCPQALMTQYPLKEKEVRINEEFPELNEEIEFVELNELPAAEEIADLSAKEASF